MNSLTVKAFTKSFLAVASAVLLELSSISPAMSISPEQVQKKLEVIAVFVLINEDGEFYQISQDDVALIPLYLSASNAQSQLDKLLGSNQGLKGQVQAFSLNLFYKKAEQLRLSPQLSGKKLATPIITQEEDMDRAVEILKSEGVSSEKIERGLRVPVFFSEPMISAQTSDGDRDVFFMSYNQILRSIQRLPANSRDALKVRVADLDFVLNLIAQEERDRFVFEATDDYIALMEKLLKKRE